MTVKVKPFRIINSCWSNRVRTPIAQVAPCLGQMEVYSKDNKVRGGIKGSSLHCA